jgi:HAD domain in Swiss Army Knife RNA repair proteins
MAIAVKALLLLDIDGVLNPFAADEVPAGYAEVCLFPGEGPVLVNPVHGEWVRELASVFDVVWASGWGRDANAYLAPLLRLPPLGFVPMPVPPFVPEAKTAVVADFVADRPVVWIDDEVTDLARSWAAARREATLLVAVDPAVGLTRGQVEHALRWSESRGSTEPVRP